MGSTEADRLNEGLRRSFLEVFPRIEDAWFEERAGYLLMVCPRIPFPGFSGLRVEGPDESLVVGELATAIAEVDRAGVPCWISVRAGRTLAVEREARRLGFTNEEVSAGMVLRPDELSVRPDPELDIIENRDITGLAAATDVAAAGFEEPREPIAALFTPAVAAMLGLSIYVAYVGGRPVSTATSWLGDGAVGIFNVATPPEYRGRGYGRAVTARAISDGFAAGADLAWLQASPLGERVYRAMGFRQVDTYLDLGRPTVP